MTTQTGAAHRHHRRAVRFFWALLIGATFVSLVGNIAHAALPHIPSIAVQVGAAAVPPVVLLVAVHGIALAVRAGASGRVYHWAVGAIAVIGGGAFAVSFLALRDLAQIIGYSAQIAWVFPAIIDTAVAVSTLMLVALGEKPARGARQANRLSAAVPPAKRRDSAAPRLSTKSEVTSTTTRPRRTSEQASQVQAPALRQPSAVHQDHGSVRTEAAQHDADVATDLIASGATTQSVKTVVFVLDAVRRGASINKAATQAGINYRTAQRIVNAADVDRRDQRVTAS